MLYTKVFYCLVDTLGRPVSGRDGGIEEMMNVWMEANQKYNALEIVSATSAMGSGSIHASTHSITLIYRTTPIVR